jgi:hypothetical protein
MKCAEFLAPTRIRQEIIDQYPSSATFIPRLALARRNHNRTVRPPPAPVELDDRPNDRGGGPTISRG